MTYKELLELYKADKLDLAQKEKLEREIEKQTAISEYLFENEEIPDVFDADLASDSDVSNDSADDAKLIKMIKKSIRKAFIKLGVVVCIVALCLVLLVNSTLPKLVDLMYYNPAAVAGNINGTETNQMSLDTMVYTELFTPGCYRTNVIAEQEGFGNYDIKIPQNFSRDGQFKDVYGTVEKGKLTLFSDDLFKTPTGNAFTPGNIDGVVGYSGTGAAGSKENVPDKLNQLNDTDYYLGYVTLNKVMSYDEFVLWCEKNDLKPDWCAICRFQGNSKDYDPYVINETIGFNYNCCSSQMAYDAEKYPYLNYFDMIPTEKHYPMNMFSAEVMETHVKSLLSYMLDNKSFCEMAGSAVSDYELTAQIESIEEHGLDIYGFAITAQKSELLKIYETENVDYIYAAPLN